MNLLKSREDERKTLQSQVTNLNMKICDLESFLLRASKDNNSTQIQREAEYLKVLWDEQNKLIKELESDLEFQKQSVLEMEQELVDERSKNQVQENPKDIKVLKKQLHEINKVNQKLQEEKDSLYAQMVENENGLINKIRELEQPKSNKKLKFNSSFGDKSLNRSAFSQINEMSYSTFKDLSYKHQIESGEVLVSKEVGEYIKKLLEKIRNYNDKLKKVRSQRDKLKQFYDKYKARL